MEYLLSGYHADTPGNKWIDAFITGITDSGRSYETQVDATGKQLTRNRSHTFCIMNWNTSIYLSNMIWLGYKIVINNLINHFHIYISH